MFPMGYKTIGQGCVHEWYKVMIPSKIQPRFKKQSWAGFKDILMPEWDHQARSHTKLLQKE